MSSETDFQELVIASVLHDIGKLFQRCKDKRYEKGNEIHESLYCPYNKAGNYFGYRHVLSTYGFLEKNRDVFPSGLNTSTIVETASKHHKPDSALDTIIQQADWISAGHDRMFEEDENMPESVKYYEQPLNSVFSSVEIFDNRKPLNTYYGLIPLSDYSGVFPEKKYTQLTPAHYQNIADKFENDIKSLKALPFKQFLYGLNTLLKEYTWCIPASTNSKPDISLYDHLVTTAGFAAVLYRYHEEMGNLDDNKALCDGKQKKFLFISGDLSGIQDYIFDLKTTAFNAKILRARSFELQLISESVSRTILDKSGLPPFCKLMDAGGRFILVLPNSKKTRIDLNELRIEIERSLLKQYLGELTLNISKPVEVNSDDLDQMKAREVFHNIALSSAMAKIKKLQTALSSEGHILHYNYDRIHGNENVCPICEVRPTEKEFSHYGNTYSLCSVCYGLVRLGERIPKTRYVILKDEYSSYYNESSDYKLPIGGIISLKENVNRKKLNDNDIVFSINTLEPAFARITLPFYLPREKDNDEILTFEQLAKMGSGSEKIAMLKADVDNLGFVFSQGLGKSLSVSRYSTLSRMMNHFFSAYLNHIIVKRWPNIYTVFSGGDDVCIIGPWQDVIGFASDVRKSFSDFTGSNANITISGGIVLSSPHVPVRYIAKNAEKLLELSKSTESKNKVTLFNVPVDWNTFTDLIEFGDNLIQYIEAGKITRGLVYRLLYYARNEKDMKHGNINKEKALWRSHLYYDISRNGKNLSNKERNELLAKTEKNISRMEIPVQYALYRIR